MEISPEIALIVEADVVRATDSNIEKRKRRTQVRDLAIDSTGVVDRGMYTEGSLGTWETLSFPLQGGREAGGKPRPTKDDRESQNFVIAKKQGNASQRTLWSEGGDGLVGTVGVKDGRDIGLRNRINENLTDSKIGA